MAKRLKSNRLSHFAHGETFPKPKQAEAHRLMWGEFAYAHLGDSDHRPSETILVYSADSARKLSAKCRREKWPIRFAIDGKIVRLSTVVSHLRRSRSR